MAKIRTVKPELFRHDALFESERHYQLPLRLAFIGLFSCCDREGRFRWEPRSLKLDILPYDELNFTEVLNALWQAGFIKKYQHQHKYYGHIPSWHQHQSINKHEPASKYPDPENGTYETVSEDHYKLPTLQCTTMQEALPDLHMHAYASQSMITTADSFKKCSTKTSLDAPNNAAPIRAEKTSPSASVIQNEIPHSSMSKATQPTIHPLPNNQLDHKSLANQPAEPINSNLTRISSQQNPSLNSSNTEMHMQAYALQKSDSAMHNVTSAAQMHASLEVEVEMEVEREMERKVPTQTKAEKKQDWGANPNIVAQARRCRASSAHISAVFNHWKAVMQHPNALLDKKRTGLIREALQQGYTVDQLCEAISGCAKTPHNLGQNEHNQRYDGLHVILRDADQIERFIRNCHNPPRSSTPADQLLRANTSVGENWLKRNNPFGDSRHGKSR